MLTSCFCLARNGIAQQSGAMFSNAEPGLDQSGIARNQTVKRRKIMAEQNIKSVEKLEVMEPTYAVINIPVIGRTPLMTQALSVQKGKDIIAKELGISEERKIRNLDDEYEAAFYRNENGDACLPSNAFMRAMIEATVDLKNVAKTQVKRAISVEGDLYKINHSRIVRDERIVIRKGRNKAPNVACRPVFHDWSIDVQIAYDTSLISEHQLINLLNRAGYSQGVGSYRPSCSGQFGKFKVDTDKMNSPKWQRAQRELVAAGR